MLFREVGGRKGLNDKKDHLVVKKGMITAEFISFLRRWPPKRGLCYKKFKKLLYQ